MVHFLFKEEKKITLSYELPEDEKDIPQRKIQFWEEPFVEVITYKILAGKSQ